MYLYKYNMERKELVQGEKGRASSMVLILDGNSEHVSHAWSKKSHPIYDYSRYTIKCQNRSNNRDVSLRAHLFLSYHLIPWFFIVRGNSENIVHTWKEKQVFLEKKSNLRLLSIYIKALNRSNYRHYSSRAHLFLSYHPISVQWNVFNLQSGYHIKFWNIACFVLEMFFLL